MWSFTVHVHIRISHNQDKLSPRPVLILVSSHPWEHGSEVNMLMGLWLLQVSLGSPLTHAREQQACWRSRPRTAVFGKQTFTLQNGFTTFLLEESAKPIDQNEWALLLLCDMGKSYFFMHNMDLCLSVILVYLIMFLYFPQFQTLFLSRCQQTW